MPAKKKSTASKKMSSTTVRKSRVVASPVPTGMPFRSRFGKWGIISLVIVFLSLASVAAGFQGYGPLSSMFESPSVNKIVLDDTKDRLVTQTKKDERNNTVTVKNKKTGQTTKNVKDTDVDKVVKNSPTNPNTNPVQNLVSCCRMEKTNPTCNGTYMTYIDTYKDKCPKGLYSCSDKYAPIESDVEDKKSLAAKYQPSCFITGRGGANADDPAFFNCSLELKLKDSEVRTIKGSCGAGEVSLKSKDFFVCPASLTGLAAFNCNYHPSHPGAEKVSYSCCQNQQQKAAENVREDCRDVVLHDSVTKKVMTDVEKDAYTFTCESSCGNKDETITINIGGAPVVKSVCRKPNYTPMGNSTLVGVPTMATCCMKKK